jgi:hypothetical protein
MPVFIEFGVIAGKPDKTKKECRNPVRQLTGGDIPFLRFPPATRVAGGSL